MTVSNRPISPVRSRIRRQLRLEEATPTLRPAAFSSRTKATVESKTSTFPSRIRRLKRSFLALPTAQTVSKPGGADGSPCGRRIPRDSRKEPAPS